VGRLSRGVVVDRELKFWTQLWFGLKLYMFEILKFLEQKFEISNFEKHGFAKNHM
jgi:hypothetical protein